MPGLSNEGLDVFYNGVTFGVDAETTDVSIRPVPDASGRTVRHCVYAFTIKAFIADVNQAMDPPASTDGVMEELQTRLLAYGGAFSYQNVGLGQIVVNIPEEAAGRDVVWGPRPQMLKWKPHGQHACEILWSVEVAIPVGDSATFAFGAMEFNYSLRWSVDRSGYTRRTYSGHLSVPQTRASQPSRHLTDHADRWRESINPPVPVGFRRTPGDFELSFDKCKLTFSIVDEEVGPNYPPPGVIDVQASQSCVNQKAFAAPAWTTTLQATYEMERGAERWAAWGHFKRLLYDRMYPAGAVQVGGALIAGGLGGVSAQVLRSLTVSDPDIYGRKGAQFSATWTSTWQLQDILRASGLWRPVPANDWGAWARSLSQRALSSRGNAGMRFQLNEDAIVDLNMPPETFLSLPKAGAAPAPPPLPGGLEQAAPPAAASWIRYESWVRVEAEEPVAELKTVPPDPNAVARQWLAEMILPAAANGPGAIGGGLLQAQAGGAIGGVVQRPARATQYAVLHGSALRVGHRIFPPTLAAYGGVAAVEANRRDGEGFQQKVAAYWFGVPVYAAAWRLRYLLAGTPRGVVPMAENPFGGV